MAKKDVFVEEADEEAGDPWGVAKELDDEPILDAAAEPLVLEDPVVPAEHFLDGQNRDRANLRAKRK